MILHDNVGPDRSAYFGNSPVNEPKLRIFSKSDSDILPQFIGVVATYTVDWVSGHPLKNIATRFAVPSIDQGVAWVWGGLPGITYSIMMLAVGMSTWGVLKHITEQSKFDSCVEAARKCEYGSGN